MNHYGYSQSTIDALLSSPLRVRVQMTDDASDNGGECTLGEYARGVFDVFDPDDGPDSETIGILISIAALPQMAQAECGPDTVTMLEDQ